MDTNDFAIKKENIFLTFLAGWSVFLSTIRLSFKHIIIPVAGELFGILLISLVPILEYREMINVKATPDGWIYFALSLSGLIIFIYSLWKFFVVLCGVNLLARDIYDDRAIANISFYTSDVLRKKWSYIRFLTGYLAIALIFAALSAGIMFFEAKLVVYNFITSTANITLLLIQSGIFLTYILFSNIIIQQYSFNRILGFWEVIKRTFKFIGRNFTGLTILSFITVIFSNIIAYIVQVLITFLITNPLGLSADNSAGVAVRFTIGFIINAFIMVLVQYIYARFYLLEQNSYNYPSNLN